MMMRYHGHQMITINIYSTYTDQLQGCVLISSHTTHGFISFALGILLKSTLIKILQTLEDPPLAGSQLKH